MEISFSEQDGVTVAALSGRLDSATSGEAQQALASGIDGCGRLLLDLEKVAYVSSAGLRVFLMLAKQSRAAGGRLALCSLAPEVKEVFDISGFTALFMLLPDRVSGLNALSD
jgi:putative anti-sigma factor antagonist btrV